MKFIFIPKGKLKMKIITEISVRLFFLLAVILIGCGTSPLTMTVIDEKAFNTSKSITILDFSTAGAQLNYQGNADSLGHALAVLLQQELQKKADYLEATLNTKETLASDLIVEGGFKNIDEGDAEARVIVGQEGVTLELDGVVKKTDGTVVANFYASKTSAGGPIGMGGLLAGDSDVIIDDLMNEIADELSDFIVSKTTGNRQ